MILRLAGDPIVIDARSTAFRTAALSVAVRQGDVDQADCP